MFTEVSSNESREQVQLPRQTRLQSCGQYLREQLQGGKGLGSQCRWVPVPALWLRSFFLADRKQSDEGVQEEVRVRCNSKDNPPHPHSSLLPPTRPLLLLLPLHKATILRLHQDINLLMTSEPLCSSLETPSHTLKVCLLLSS